MTTATATEKQATSVEELQVQMNQKFHAVGENLRQLHASKANKSEAPIGQAALRYKDIAIASVVGIAGALMIGLLGSGLRNSVILGNKMKEADPNTDAGARTLRGEVNIVTHHQSLL